MGNLKNIPPKEFKEYKTEKLACISCECLFKFLDIHSDETSGICKLNKIVFALSGMESCYVFIIEDV